MMLEKELAKLLNQHSIENESDTPDFILAQFLLGCLKIWGEATKERDSWYDFQPWNTVNEKEKHTKKFTGVKKKKKKD